MGPVRAHEDTEVGTALDHASRALGRRRLALAVGHEVETERGHEPPRPTRTAQSPTNGPPPLQEEGPRAATAHRLLDLQRTAGNRAVRAIVDRRPGDDVAQRVEVKEAEMKETLYTQPGAGNKAKANEYAITPRYVLTRNGDSGVTVKVRVQFLHQVRDATGALTDKPVDIPARIGIPTARRCIYWLHTHTPDGMLHIEAPLDRSFTLGDLFTVVQFERWSEAVLGNSRRVEPVPYVLSAAAASA